MTKNLDQRSRINFKGVPGMWNFTHTSNTKMKCKQKEMKYILSALSILIILVSCNYKFIKMAPPLNLPSGTVSLKMIPEPFIPELPDKLHESSGLIYYDGLLWTINDSGGENKIYGFDFSGNIQREITVKNTKNDDWEEIAQDEKNIYIGDFGNNNGTRKNLRIFKIEKKDLDANVDEVGAEVIKFAYINQKSFQFTLHDTPFDCEAMAELNNQLYLFSKNWDEQTTTVYKVPKNEGNFNIVPEGTFNVNGLVTGADVSPDKKSLVLVGYRDFIPFIWLFSNFTDDHFFSGEKSFILLDSITDAQTEGICFLNNNILLISCEQTSSFPQQVFLFNTKAMKMYGTHQDKQNN